MMVHMVGLWILLLLFTTQHDALIVENADHPVFKNYELLNYETMGNKMSVKHYLDNMKDHARFRRSTMKIVVRTINSDLEMYMWKDLDTHIIHHETILFVEGRLKGYPLSSARGWISNGVFYGTIVVNSNLTYHIEDFFHHAPNINVNQSYRPYHSMIFKNNDLNETFLEPAKCKRNHSSWHKIDEQIRRKNLFTFKRLRNRVIRSSETTEDDDDEYEDITTLSPDHKNVTCTVALTLHKTFMERYQSIPAAVAMAHYIIGRASKIFEEDIRIKKINGGIRFQLVKVNIPYEVGDIFGRAVYDPELVLGVLEKREERTKYCIQGAFVHQNWNSVIGLASLRSPGDTVCDQTAVFAVTTQFSGLSLTLAHSILVTAHELGHTLSAFHDPHKDCDKFCYHVNRTDCMGKSYTGGDGFLMNYALNLGMSANNYKFSNCSIDAFTKLLKNGKKRCLLDHSEQICGNGIKEGSEECDGGIFNVDRCCTKECKLKPKMKCSPMNSECCTEDCQFKKSKERCDTQNECRTSGTCSGNNDSCIIGAAKDNQKCNSGTGWCNDGECSKSICEKDTNRKACGCTGMKECKVCCANITTTDAASSGSTGIRIGCVTMKPEINQPLGHPCNNGSGYCDQTGKCLPYHGESGISKMYQYLNRPPFWTYTWELINKIQLIISLVIIFITFGVATKFFNVSYSKRLASFSSSG